MKIENINVYNLYPAIIGIRNSFKSTDKSDSTCLINYHSEDLKIQSYNHCSLGDNDKKLIEKLLHRTDEYGHQERKFLRQILVSMDITGSIKFWSQMDTYKIGTIRNSESTMHCITKGKLTQDNFEREINPLQLDFLNKTILYYNEIEDKEKKKHNFELIDANLPAGYLLKSHWTGNYENLRNIFHGRKLHKMYWWKEFCDVIEKLPYADLLIT